jgi:outer membrane protein OmpA-like peptidoglycan-associated protein
VKTLEPRPTSALLALPRAATKRRLGVPSLGAHDVPRTSGEPLDASMREYMEPRFARDFSHVRVHADDASAASARALGSLAYTTGQHVVFAPGRYRPDERSGRELLAHELTHVVQQSDVGATEPAVSGPADASEDAAARTAAAVAAGGPAPATAPVARPPAIQRTPDTDLTVPPPQLAPMFALGAKGSTSIDAFDHDKAGLTADQQGLLTGHAGVLKELFEMDPTATVDVVGHADASGSQEHNMPLSEQRAEAAKAALVAAGADPAKIAAKGVGEHDLKVKTTAAHAANRRVEVRFHPSLRFSNLPGPAPWPSILPQLSISQPARAEPALDAQALAPIAPGLPPGYMPSAPAPAPAPTLAPTAPTPRVMHPELLSPQPWFRQPQPKPGPKPWSFHDQIDADPALDYVPDVLHGPVVSLIEAFPGIVAGKAAGITPGSEKAAEASQAATSAAVTTLQGERYKQDVPQLFPPDTSAQQQLDKTQFGLKIPIDFNPAASRKQAQEQEKAEKKREARRKLKDAQAQAEQEAAERRYAEIEAAKEAAEKKEAAAKEAAKRAAAEKEAAEKK